MYDLVEVHIRTGAHFNHIGPYQTLEHAIKDGVLRHRGYKNVILDIIVKDRTTGKTEFTITPENRDKIVWVTVNGVNLPGILDSKIPESSWYNVIMPNGGRWALKENEFIILGAENV